jgi:3-methyladenine DNA glycosylase AlkD
MSGKPVPGQAHDTQGGGSVPNIDPLLAQLRAALRAAGDPARALGMQRYMKSEMPYLGCSMPVLRQVCREVFAAVELPDADRWEALVLSIWRAAAYREERYAALQLTGDRRARAFQTPRAVPMYDELVVTGAWWDYVDLIAARRLGPILRAFPGQLRPLILAWARDENLWRRRTAIICQLGAKGETDTDLLEACIAPSLGSREFFLRKGIGWALREYAKTDPDWVRAYVTAHDGELSGLSKREALRNLG